MPSVFLSAKIPRDFAKNDLLSINPSAKAGDKEGGGCMQVPIGE
jgi:hypothetical protein